MTKTTTQRSLLLYAYNECALFESDGIQRSIDGDPLVQQEFNEMVNIIQSLDKVVLDPSKKSIEAILAFARTHRA